MFKYIKFDENRIKVLKWEEEYKNEFEMLAFSKRE